MMDDIAPTHKKRKLDKPLTYMKIMWPDFQYIYDDDDDEFILYGEGFQQRCSLRIES